MTNEIIKENIDHLIYTASEFLQKVVNPPLEELGGLLADKIRFWRFKNQMEIILKAQNYLEDKRIQPKKIPLKTLASLLTNCSWEEEEYMKTKWAALLANTIDSRSVFDIHSSYVEILDQLSSFEVKILDKMYDEYENAPDNEKDGLMFEKSKICHSMNIKSNEFDIIIDNLFRLNLLQPPASHGGVSIGKFPIVLRTYEFIQLTPLGYDFVKYCRFD